MQFIQQLHSLVCVYVRFLLAVLSYTGCQMARFCSAFMALATKKHKIHLSGTCQGKSHGAPLWRVY